MSATFAATVAPIQRLSPMFWRGRARSSMTSPSSVTRRSFVRSTPSRAAYASVSSALEMLPSPNLEVHSWTSTGAAFQLNEMAAASSSKNAPTGVFKKSTS